MSFGLAFTVSVIPILLPVLHIFVGSTLLVLLPKSGPSFELLL
jgi:hypothetical protein